MLNSFPGHHISQKNMVCSDYNCHPSVSKFSIVTSRPEIHMSMKEFSLKIRSKIIRIDFLQTKHLKKNMFGNYLLMILKEPKT